MAQLGQRVKNQELFLKFKPSKRGSKMFEVISRDVPRQDFVHERTEMSSAQRSNFEAARKNEQKMYGYEKSTISP